MKALRIVAVLIIIGTAMVIAGDGKMISENRTFNLSVVTTGDTAQVIGFTPSTALDSFVYYDSLKTSSDTCSFVWLSPVQTMAFTLTAVDTAQTAVCSISLAGGELGFEYDCPSTDDSSGAYAEDLKDSLNAVVGDSITATRTANVVTITSDYSEATYTARWSMIWTEPGSNDFDSASSLVPTIASVCDSIVANAVCATTYTLSDSTTYYAVTADDPGLAYTIVSSDSTKDAAADTSLLQANVTSYSRSGDTLGLIPLIGQGYRYKNIYGRFIIEPSIITTQGIGEVDSGFIYLYTVFADEYSELASTSSNALPCTLRVAIGQDTVGGSVDPDTLFKAALALGIVVTDSASDTTATIPYNLKTEYILTE